MTRLTKSKGKKKKTKFCAIVIPVFNEQQNLPKISEKIFEVFSSILNLHARIIFVNDGSIDQSWEVIQSLNHKNSDILGADFSRNFGKENALTAGLNLARNYDLVITMDADLQHPPSKIPEMVALWEKGYETVIGVRVATKNETLIRKLGSTLFHKIMKSISDLDSHPSSTDFRLYSKNVVQAICKLEEKDRIFRGLADWVGFKKTTIDFDSDERIFGESTFSIGRLVNLAFTSFISFSLWPLKAIIFLGLSIFFLSALILTSMIIDSIFFQYLSSSPLAYGLMSVLAALGIIILILGVISLYIGKVSQEVLNRPNFIIREFTDDFE